VVQTGEGVPSRVRRGAGKARDPADLRRCVAIELQPLVQRIDEKRYGDALAAALDLWRAQPSGLLADLVDRLDQRGLGRLELTVASNDEWLSHVARLDARKLCPLVVEEPCPQSSLNWLWPLVFRRLSAIGDVRTVGSARFGPSISSAQRRRARCGRGRRCAEGAGSAALKRAHRDAPAP